MTSRPVALPAALSPWSSTLSLLEPRLALALGPMLRTLDELVRRGDAAAASTGEMDGYDGLDTRGDPSQLALSQWALADTVPSEFLRRAASGELLYLRRTRVEESPRGEMAVLVDSGPEQIGAGRLVQLATIVVLMGRAARRGATLRLGVLGARPGTWAAEGELELLDRWLHSRRSQDLRPDGIAEAVRAWTADLDDADEAWVLVGPRAATALPGRRRIVAATECAWTADGASAVDVRVDGRRAELTLPHGDVAVRALRGALLRPVAEVGAPARITGWTFTGAGPALLARDPDPDVLVRLEVRPEAPGRPKLLRFDGRVVTAAVLGRRVVALVERDGGVRVEVRGKHLGRIAGLEVPADDLDLASTVPAFAPLVYDRGGLLVRLGERWWHLDAEGGVRPEPDVVAVCPTAATDAPVIVRVSRDGTTTRLSAGTRTLAETAGPVEEVFAGSDGRLAWRTGPREWHLGAAGRTVTLSDGESVVGMHDIDGDPALVVVTRAAGVVRLRWPAGSRTLTAWSDGEATPSVHPTRPWIAVQRGGSVVEVGDLGTGELLLHTDAR